VWDATPSNFARSLPTSRRNHWQLHGVTYYHALSGRSGLCYFNSHRVERRHLYANDKGE
jgi:hypothetical protein